MACVLVIFWLLFAGAWVEELPAFVRLAFRGRQPGAHAEGRLLRIVSLNCANTSRWLANLKRVQPDILLLQEAPGNDGLAEMARELFGSEGGFLGGGDTAILARWPIERRFIDRTYHFVVGSIVSDGGQRIECVSLRLAPPVSRLDVWSRGFWKEHRQRRQQHRQQLQQVQSQSDHALQNAALIVGGDFNTTPPDPALEVLRPELARG